MFSCPTLPFGIITSKVRKLRISANNALKLYSELYYILKLYYIEIIYSGQHSYCGD